MTTAKTLKSILLAAMLCTALSAEAYELRSITIQNGLSNSSVLSILQQRDGKVAFGTCDGINAYDGVRAWKTQVGSKLFAEGNIIEAMEEGPDGIDWILTDHGLTRFNSIERRNSFFPKFQGLTKLRTNPDGDVFLLTDDSLHFSHPSTDDILSCPIEGISLRDVRDYAVTDKYFFIFKSDGTLRYPISKGDEGYNVGLPIRVDNTPIQVASNDENIEFLVNAEGMLQRYNLVNGEKRSLCSLRSEMEHRGKISQIIDYSGTIFVAFYTSGLISIEQDQGRVIVQELPIKAGVMSLRKYLKGHIVWIGTDGQGVVMYHEPVVTCRSVTFNDLWIDNEKPVRAIRMDDDGTLWIGTKGNGIITLPHFDTNGNYRQMPRQLLRRENSGLSDDVVYSFADSRRPLFWICTDEGLDYYSHETHTIQHVETDQPLPYVIKAWEQGDTLWIVSLGTGIYQADIRGTAAQPRLTNIRHYTLDGGRKSSNYFFDMTNDDEGNLWFANRGQGVCTLRDGKLEKVPYSNTYENKNVEDVFAVLSLNGELWIGTGYGIIIKHKDGKESFITTDNGLPNNTIHALLEGSDGNVSASTNNGVVCFMSGDKDNPVFFNNGKVTEYSDGAVVFTDDKAFYGGTNGISIIHYTERTPMIEIPPRLQFSNLSIFGRHDDIFNYLKVNGDQSTLTLDYTQATFSLGLSSLNYSEEADIEYYYRLSPREAWVPNGIHKEISFFRFPTGKHTLYVKYKNHLTGVESPDFRLNIHITPPWYWAWWSKLLYLLLGAVFIGYVFRLIWLREKHKQQVALDLLEQQHRDEMYEEKLNFLTNVVHELNTPLTLIYGPCERILAHTNTDSYVKKYIVQIIENLRRIHYLIQEIIDFRRVTTGHHTITLRRVDVTSFSNDVVNSFMDLAERNNIKLEHEISEGIIWNTDERALLRIITNLTSNAFKYTNAEGTISVRVSAADNVLRMSVYNTGKGIAPEDQERIFNYYSIFQHSDEGSAHGLTSRNGLGMAICYKMVQKLDGLIVINSEVGKYAEFVVTLPQQTLPEGTTDEVVTADEFKHEVTTPATMPEVKEPTAPAPLRPAKKDMPETGAGATILAIDDNQEILTMLKDCLVEYHVMTAHNAEEGLEMLKHTLPDLIITDIMMPGANGLDFTLSIKQNKHTMHIPLIILSAKSSTEEKIQGLDSGADVYISKPFSISYLRATIIRLLENHAVLREYYNTSASAYTYASGKLLKSEEQKFLAEVKRVLDAHLNDSDLTPDTLAELLNTSSRSLYRRFSEMGLSTPKEFMRNHRLEAASKLLTTTSMTVQEIIYECGFNTRTQFYNDFRKHFGITPKEYREKNMFKDESL